jgi:hypothetical protein
VQRAHTPERNLRAAQLATLATGMARKGAGISIDDAILNAGGDRALVAIGKQAVAGTTSLTDEALVLYEAIVQGFLAALSNHGTFDAVLPDMPAATINQKFGVIVSVPRAAAVAEGQAAPVTRFAASNGIVRERRAAAIIAVSREVARSATAVLLMQSSVLEGVAATADATFLAELAVAASAMASNGGLTAADVLADLAVALRSMPTDARSRVHLVVGPDCAKRLSLMPEASGSGARAFPEMSLAGGVIANLPTHVSDQLTNDVLLIDAASYCGAAGGVEISTSSQADLKMATDAGTLMSAGTGSPLQPVEATMVSMFQTGLVGVLVERVIAFEPLRAGGVIKITNTAWGKTGSPPA